MQKLLDSIQHPAFSISIITAGYITHGPCSLWGRIFRKKKKVERLS